LVVDMVTFAVLGAAGMHPSPVPHAQIVTTTTHKTLRGPRGGLILCREVFGKDVDKQVFPGIQGGPLEHVIAAKAVALGEALTPAFKQYAIQVVKNAQALAAALLQRGYAIVSGGTDTHLMLVDLRPKGLTGKEAQTLLDRAGITVNKNTIPGDPQSAFVTSGSRSARPRVPTPGSAKHGWGKLADGMERSLRKQTEAPHGHLRDRRRGRRLHGHRRHDRGGFLRRVRRRHPHDRGRAQAAARGQAALPCDGSAGRPVRAPLPPPRGRGPRLDPRQLRARLPRGAAHEAPPTALGSPIREG